MPDRPLWLLIDVSNWAYRDLFGAGLGMAFTRRVELCAEFFSPEQIVFAFDSPTSFRAAIDPGYKANRRKDPPAGLGRLIDAVERYGNENGYDIARTDGFEADDVIATLAKIGVEGGRNVLMASSDKDLRQCLVAGRVSQLLSISRPPKPKRKPICEYKTAKTLEREIGLSPDQWPEYQLLAGDASDNVRGCEGIGKVAALELLHRCGSIRGYFANPWDANLSARQRARLSEFRRSELGKTRRLVTLRTDLPLLASWRESVAS